MRKTENLQIFKKLVTNKKIATVTIAKFTKCGIIKKLSLFKQRRKDEKNEYKSRKN